MSARFANVSEVPLALAVFLASDYYDYSDDPNEISATTLLKPLRQIILAKRVPPGDGMTNLADMMNSRMGAAIHDGIEKSWVSNYRPAMEALGLPQRVIDRIRINPTQSDLDVAAAQGIEIIPIYLEQRLKRKIGKWTVTGKFDFVGEGKVQDFKSTSTFTYKKQVNADKYIQQGSIYRWLDEKLITQDRMDIHYIFTDWKPAMAKTDPSYPPKRFHTQSFDLMSPQETENFIRRKLELIEQYWDADEDDIPQCDDTELWRSEPVFKYYKNPEKTARSTKNFDTRPEAYAFMATNGNVGIVKEVPGQVTACKYCPAFAACSQKDLLVASGDLIL
jgi:hypothetical protein